MEISGKAIVYSILFLVVVLLLSVSFGVIDLNQDASSQQSQTSGNIPEKCQLPSGQDVNSWKEHLGHHSETKECLKYFD